MPCPHFRWEIWIFAIKITRSAYLHHKKFLLRSQTEIGNITDFGEGRHPAVTKKAGK